jgi:hypothetical protein
MTDKRQQVLERLQSLHEQNVPFFYARNTLLEEGYTPLEIINGAYLFKEEPKVADSEQLKKFLSENPDAAEKIANAFILLEQNGTVANEQYKSIEDFSKYLKRKSSSLF